MMSYLSDGYEQVHAAEVHIDRAVGLLTLDKETPLAAIELVRDLNSRLAQLRILLEAEGAGLSKSVLCDADC